MPTLDDVGGEANGGGVFLDKEARDELHQNGYPFKIVDAVPAREGGKYGTQTIFTIRFGQKNAPGWAGNSDTWLIGLSHNSQREEFAKRCLKAIAANPEDPEVGPVYYCKSIIESGKWAGEEYVSFKAEPDAAPSKPKGSSTGTTRKTNPSDGDDDIPFAANWI